LAGQTRQIRQQKTTLQTQLKADAATYPHQQNHEPAGTFVRQNVVQDCMPIIEHLAGSKGIECRIEVSDDMPVLFADRSSITQILINLLTNAIKFSGEGATVRPIV